MSCTRGALYLQKQEVDTKAVTPNITPVTYSMDTMSTYFGNDLGYYWIPSDDPDEEDFSSTSIPAVHPVSNQSEISGSHLTLISNLPFLTMLERIMKTNTPLRVNLVPVHSSSLSSTLQNKLSQTRHPQSAKQIVVEERGTAPRYFVDVSKALFAQQMPELATEMLSNVVELELDNPQLYR